MCSENLIPIGLWLVYRKCIMLEIFRVSNVDVQAKFCVSFLYL